jgi:hypothetical protein
MMTKNLEKNYSWKNLYFYDKKLQFTRPPKRTSKLKEKPSALKRELQT